MKYAIVTYGQVDGKHTRKVDPKIYTTRQKAEDEIADRIEIGDVAACEGRMRVEEAGNEKA